MPLYLGQNKIQQLKVALVGLANQLNLQSKTVTPNSNTQEVLFDSEYDALEKVIVNPVPTETKSISENGTYNPSTGKYFSQVTVDVQPDEFETEEIIITPSETQQVKTPTTDGFSKVTVNAVSSTYVGSGISRKSSSDLTTSGATVSVPSGYYENGASKSISSGSVTVGTPTVSSTGLITASATVSAGYVSSNPSNKTKQLTVQGAKTVTPNETEQTVVSSGVFTTGTIKVSAIPSDYIGSDVVIQKFYKGTSTPSNSIGQDGDWYLKVRG